MRSFILIWLLAIVLPVPSISQSEPVGISGLVLKPDGQPITGAFIVVRDYQQTDPAHISDSWQSRTGEQGNFSFAVPRGCYDIFVSANLRFLPSAQRVCTQSGAPVLRIKLKADPHPILLQD